MDVTVMYCMHSVASVRTVLMSIAGVTTLEKEEEEEKNIRDLFECMNIQ